MTDRVDPALRSWLPAVAFPAIPNAAGAALLDLLYQFERSEWWPADQIRRQQFVQLAALADHARRNVPAYASRLDAAGIRPDRELTEAQWRRIPVLTRREVLDLGPALHAPQDIEGHGRRRVFKTTGSTGRPVQGVMSERFELYWHAMTLRNYLWHGWNPGGKLATIRSEIAAVPAEGAVSAAWTSGAAAVFAGGQSFLQHTSRPPRELLAWLRRVEPDYLLAFPSVLREVAREAQRDGTRLPSLRGVTTIAEPLTAALRAQVRAAFGVPVYDLYSSVDCGYMALQCPEHEHLHVMAESALVEVLDESGRACGPGEVGRVVVTPLHNFAMPLIRYELGDLAEAGAPCACGRGLPVLRRVIGRFRNMLVLPDGAKRWPLIEAEIAEIGLPIVQFQVVQRSLALLEVRLVVSRALTAADEALIRAGLRESCGAHFEVAFVYVASIPRGPGGKYEDFRVEFGDAAGAGAS